MATSISKYLRRVQRARQIRPLPMAINGVDLLDWCMRSYQRNIMRRRQLLIFVLGFGSLIAITFIGTSMESIVAFLHPTNPMQKAQAGPYQVTLQVTPNPPATTRPADLTLQIVHSATQQLLTNAHVSVESNMEAMDMGTDHIDASQQSTGIYLARVQFTMSGIWQGRVVSAIPGQKTESAVFAIAAQ